jgi:hypothetical protein
MLEVLRKQLLKPDSMKRLVADYDWRLEEARLCNAEKGVNTIYYGRIFDYLKTCGGCTGPRSLARCRYALACAVVEVLAKKRVIDDSEKLLHYYPNRNRSNINYCGAEERDCTSDARTYAGVGPCSGE